MNDKIELKMRKGRRVIGSIFIENDKHWKNIINKYPDFESLKEELRNIDLRLAQVKYDEMKKTMEETKKRMDELSER